MKRTTEILNQAETELQFKTARSGGSGGQHVNKVETKVILHWDIERSAILEEDEKLLLKQKLSKFITQEGVFQIYQQTERSQLKNKSKVIIRWKELVTKAFKKKKKRLKTKPSKASRLKNKKKKEQHSQIKKLRQKPKFE